MPSGPRRPRYIWVDAATCNLACDLCYTAEVGRRA